MLSIDINVNSTGTLPSPSDIDNALESAQRDGADLAVTMIKQRLGQVLRNPTGYYRSKIQVENRSSGIAVTDGGVIYGPWLEGVSSRNASTRFKGYGTFRMVAQELDKQLEKTIDQAVQKVVS